MVVKVGARGWGFLKILTVSIFIVVALAGMSTAFARATPSEHQISGFDGGRCYHVQEAQHYCGPASVQMVLDWLGVQPLPTQTELAAELGASVSGPTVVDTMPLPFQSRGLSVEERQGLSVGELKESIANDHPVIILMYLDNGSMYGHYVVVVGYNEGGVLVHDPYSTSYGSVNRGVGANVFISDNLLATLWSYSPGQWGLVIKSSPAVSGLFVWALMIAAAIAGGLIFAAAIIIKRRLAG